MTYYDEFWHEDMDGVQTSMAMDNMEVGYCELCGRPIDINFLIVDYLWNKEETISFPILICPYCFRFRHPPKRKKSS